MNTLFLKDFTVLDFAFMHPQEGLCGESLYVSAELDGDLNHQGFLFDFGPAKKLLKEAVDKEFDHKLLFFKAETIESALHFPGYVYKAPAESFVQLAEEINLKTLAQAMSEKIFPLLPKNISGLRILLREDERFKSEANFRYTHGLRLHEGNCQRLFHGHRNPVEVWHDGARDSNLEMKLAAHWSGAHFAHVETVASKTEQAKISYTSPQGFFEAQIPARKVFLLDSEPSIENIAKAGWEWLRAQEVRGVLKVVAYEGLNKGASYSE